MERKLPKGVNVILCALFSAALARMIVQAVDPALNAVMSSVGSAISVAADQSPLLMGFLLGGMIVSSVFHAVERKNILWPPYAPTAEAVEES